MLGSRRVTVSIKMSPEIWKQAKRVALERDLKLSQLVESAILREIRSAPIKQRTDAD
jgi:hypothetical protein